MSDLPHIMYHPPKPSEEEDNNRTIISRDMRNKIKKGGLAAIGGLNLNFDFSNNGKTENLTTIAQK